MKITINNQIYTLTSPVYVFLVLTKTHLYLRLISSMNVMSIDFCLFEYV